MYHILLLGGYSDKFPQDGNEAKFLYPLTHSIASDLGQKKVVLTIDQLLSRQVCEPFGRGWFLFFDLKMRTLSLLSVLPLYQGLTQKKSLDHKFHGF